MNIPKYSNTLHVASCSFSSSTTISDLFSCMLPNFGMHALRRLEFPSSFSVSDISFQISETDQSPVWYDLYVFDGLNNSPLIIPGCAPNTTNPLFPIWFDSVVYLRMISSNPQTLGTSVNLILQPIYQGQA